MVESRGKKRFGRSAQMGAGVALVAVGIFGTMALGSAGATGTSVEPAAARTPAAVLTDTSTPAAGEDLTGQVRDMVQEHMGLTGEEADRVADDMADHMQSMHGADTGEMLQSCTGGGDGTTSMMGGTGTGGSGMMGGSVGTTTL